MKKAGVDESEESIKQRKRRIGKEKIHGLFTCYINEEIFLSHIKTRNVKEVSTILQL